MKINCKQLRQNLEKNLAPIYLLLGEEPLQTMEAGDMIRHAAAQAGYTDTRLIFITQNSDWDAFKQAAGSQSLFSEKSLIDIRLNTALSKTGSAALKSYSENIQQDTLVIIRAKKLDARTSWVKKMVEKGVLVQIFGKNRSEMRAWVRERMLRKGLKAEDQVADILVEHLEGNLLEAAQEINKLALLHGDGLIRQEHVMTALNDHALYGSFDFSDAVVAGDGVRAVRILRGLQSNGQPPVLIVNALALQLRTLINMENRIARGEPRSKLLMRVWRSKRDVFSCALARCCGARFWQNGLRACAQLDKIIKGLGANEEWESLLDLTLYLVRPRAAIS